MTPPGDTDDAPRTEPFRLLFVCTGNTCRSPLAEALARRGIEERGWRHVEVRSAGAATIDGLPASGGALRVAREAGLDLEGHRSTRLDGTLVAASDLILAMSRSHLEAVREGGGGERAALLAGLAAGEEGIDGGGEIPDPFGQDDDAYRETLKVLDGLIRRVLDRLEPILSP